METSFWLLVLGLSVLAWPLAQPFADETAHGFDVERIESEDKLEIPASLAAVARSASSRALSVATSSGSGAASTASGEGLMGGVDHTAGVL